MHGVCAVDSGVRSVARNFSHTSQVHWYRLSLTSADEKYAAFFASQGAADAATSTATAATTTAAPAADATWTVWRSYDDLQQLAADLDLPPALGVPAAGSSGVGLLRRADKDASPVAPERVQRFLQTLLDSEHYWNAKPLLLLFVQRDVVLYRTGSVCSVCALLEKRGLVVVPATVLRRHEQVFLHLTCPHGHTTRSLLCGDYFFFARLLTLVRDADYAVDGTLAQLDVEECHRDVRGRATRAAAPFVVEVALFARGAFRSERDIQADIDMTRTLYPRERKFVVKALGNAALDMDTLNERALFVERLLPDRPLLLEVTYERLVTLCRHTNSCFLKRGIYPAVKYFIESGAEEQCERELQRLCDTVAEFEGIQLVVTLVIEPPLASLQLGGALRLLRARAGMVRVVTLQLARSPRQLLADVAARRDDDTLRCDSLDPLQLLRLVASATDNEIGESDFFPASMGAALEPMLHLLGHGLYYLRPSPFCALATCLVSAGSHHSTPVSRFFDVARFWREMLPVLPRLDDGKLGLINAKRVQRALRACLLTDTAGVPDLWPYLTDAKHAAATKAFLDSAQFLVVHNHMDVANLDLARRCQCAVIGVDTSGYVASCTACL